jgi:MFS family permease
LRYRNYRLWFFGQALSLMGTWMQAVAQGWLVYQMTGSEFALGAVTFIGTVPPLFLMLPAGALADRLSLRRVLLITQTAMMVLAFALTALAVAGVLRVWHVGLLAALLGVANSFDAPARQALAVEMVEDRRDLKNAIALNSTIFNLARVVGPAVGGAVLAILGPAWCFALNGFSFLAVIWALSRMQLPETRREMQAEPLTAQIMTGLRYILGNAPVRTMIALLGVSALFGMSYIVLLPAYAVSVLHVGETGLGGLNAAMGLGALIGSLAVASLGRSRREGLFLTTASLFFPIALLLFAFARTFPLSLSYLAVAGFALVIQNATINTMIQLIIPDQLRGRVMGVYSLVFFGTTPFGALQAGILAQALGPTAGVAIGAGINLAFAVGFLLLMPSLRRLAS